jgi:3-mercaptopyruvate sulfurtransferase SseA
MKTKVRSTQAPIILILIIGLAAIGIGILIYDAIASKNAAPAITSQDDVPRVAVEDAYQAVSRGEAVLVDTRSLEAYQQGHAAGAISLPVEEVEARLGELDPAQWYITYCT